MVMVILEIWRQLQMNQAQWSRLLLKAPQSQDCSFPSLWSQYVSYQSQSIAASISQPIDGKFRFHRHATMQELDESPDWTLLGFMITNACWEKACFCFWSILELRCTKEALRPDLLGFPNVCPAALRPRWEDLKMPGVHWCLKMILRDIFGIEKYVILPHWHLSASDPWGHWGSHTQRSGMKPACPAHPICWNILKMKIWALSDIQVTSKWHPSVIKATSNFQVAP